MGDISDGAFRRLVDWLISAPGRLLALLNVLMCRRDKPSSKK